MIKIANTHYVFVRGESNREFEQENEQTGDKLVYTSSF